MLNKIFKNIYFSVIVTFVIALPSMFNPIFSSEIF